MIFCKKSHLPFYKGIHTNLDLAIDYLMGNDPETLAMGRNEISGSSVYVNRFDFDTKPESELLFETHHLYADVHTLLEGRERILCAWEDALEQVETNEGTDYIGSTGEAVCSLRLTPDDVLIVFPYEAHKVKCRDGDAVHVRKAVIKVLI